MSATEVANIIAAEAIKTFPLANIISLPIADGGEGSLETFKAFKNATSIFTSVCDPFMRKRQAEYLMLDNHTAVIETAEAIGLTIAGEEKNPLFTTSYGVGELIQSAIEQGAKSIILALGGSSTNDGGIGMAVALGVRCYNKEGVEFLPRGGDLNKISRLNLSHIDKRIKDTTFTAMCDVDIVVTGANGASYIFAPQKGAKEKDLALLDSGLNHLTALIKATTGEDYLGLLGGGAAGGLGMGAKAFLNASLNSGIDTILSLANFDALLEGADIVVTGEGRLDTQSLLGKVVFGITRYTKKKGVPLYVVCGVNDLNDTALATSGIQAVYPSNPQKLPFEKIRENAKKDLAVAARRLFYDLKNTHNL